MVFISNKADVKELKKVLHWLYFNFSETVCKYTLVNVILNGNKLSLISRLNKNLFPDFQNPLNIASGTYKPHLSLKKFNTN